MDNVNVAQCLRGVRKSAKYYGSNRHKKKFHLDETVMQRISNRPLGLIRKRGNDNVPNLIRLVSEAKPWFDQIFDRKLFKIVFKITQHVPPTGGHILKVDVFEVLDIMKDGSPKYILKIERLYTREHRFLNAAPTIEPCRS